MHQMPFNFCVFVFPFRFFDGSPIWAGALQRRAWCQEIFQFRCNRAHHSPRMPVRISASLVGNPELNLDLTLESWVGWYEQYWKNKSITLRHVLSKNGLFTWWQTVEESINLASKNKSLGVGNLWTLSCQGIWCRFSTIFWRLTQPILENHTQKICGRKKNIKNINQPTIRDFGNLGTNLTSPHVPGGGVTKPSQLEIAVQHEDMVSCWEPPNLDDGIDPQTKNHCKWEGSINKNVNQEVSCKQNREISCRILCGTYFLYYHWHLNMRYVRIHACKHASYT